MPEMLRFSCALWLANVPEFGQRLSPILGITKEIMSRDPQVLDGECREMDDLSLALEGPSFIWCILSINISIHPISLVLKWQWVLLHEVMSPGIMVCVTLIFKAIEYVALNSPLFHNVCLEIMLFDLFIPGG
jgi:hypothetical protein